MRVQHVFMWQSLEILDIFNILTLKQIFWKTQILFKSFLVESTKSENAIYLYKLALSKANLETNRMRITKWTYNNKKKVLPVATWFSGKFCFSLRTSYKELIWWTKERNVHFHIFPKPRSFIWGFFPVSILKFKKFWTKNLSDKKNFENINVILMSEIDLNKKKIFILFLITMINKVLCVVVAVTLTAIVNKNNGFIFGVIILPLFFFNDNFILCCIH